MDEFRAVDSLDLFAKRQAIACEGAINNMVGQILTFIESITPDGDQQRAQKQIVRKVIYSASNDILRLLRESADDLRRFYGYIDGEPEYNWDVNN